MPTYEELVRLGAKPLEAAPAAPATKGLTYEQLTQLGAKPVDAPAAATDAPREDYGTFDAVAREAGNIFGAGPAIQAGLETAVSKIPIIGPWRLGNAGYDERRKLYAHAIDVGRTAHPLATGITSAVRGTAEAVGAAALSPALAAASPAVAGTLFGAVEGGGEAISHGEDAVTGLKHTAVGAAAGGVTGKVLGAVTNRLVGGKAGESEAALRKQVGGDIVGDERGASTMTARKQMADDIRDVQDVVTADPQLETAIHEARSQAPTKLGKAIDVTESRLAPLRAERPQLYDALDAELPAKGVRSGDYREHLLKSATALDATGSGEDREIADQLRDRIKIIESAEQWGGNIDVFDPRAKVGRGKDARRAGDILNELTSGREAARTDEQRAAFDEAIAQLKATTPTKKGYNPDAVVPSELVRDNVTDLQKTAYRNYGGINGTNSYQRARHTASYAESFLRDVKSGVAKKNPDLIARLDEHDKNVSALLHVKQVMQERFNRATVNDMGGVEDSTFGRAAHAAAHLKTDLLAGGTRLAAKGALGARYRLNKTVRSAERGDALAASVLDSMRKGLPLSAALGVAQQAAQSGSDE